MTLIFLDFKIKVYQGLINRRSGYKLLMNWLAHLFLSESSVEMRLGNLLADIVKGTERQKLNAQIQREIQCHYVINNLTDNHPIFQCSKQRINPNYRRFAGASNGTCRYILSPLYC